MAELLKKGEVEVALGGSHNETWERLDSWPLFTEPYRLVVASDHRLASITGAVLPSELTKERLLCRSNCENSKELMQFLDERSARPQKRHDVWTEQDLAALLESNFGIGIAPKSSVLGVKAKQLDIDGLTIERTVYAYAVAGRQRSTAASTLIKMLRAADWRVIEDQLLRTNSPTLQAVT